MPVDPGLAQDLPDGGRGDLHPEHQQFAVHPAISPAGILADQAEHQERISARSAAGGGRGRDRRACRRPIESRCQRSTVSGRTSRCSLLSRSLGSRCSSAASNARSTLVNRTRRTELPLQDGAGGAVRGSLSLSGCSSAAAAGARTIRYTEVSQSQQHVDHHATAFHLTRGSRRPLSRTTSPSPVYG